MILLGACGSRRGSRGKLTVDVSGFTAGAIVDGSLSNPVFIWSGYNPISVPTEITAITSGTTFDLRVSMIQTAGDPGVDVFAKVIIEDGDGTVRTFNTVGGGVTYLYSSGAGIAQWTWGSGANRVYETDDENDVHPYAVV